MKIQQLIEEQMQIFEKGFQMGETVVDHRWDAWKGGVLPSDIKSFMKSYGRKLIEALGEELVGDWVEMLSKWKREAKEAHDSKPSWDLPSYPAWLEAEQRLKLKEIISSLQK